MHAILMKISRAQATMFSCHKAYQQERGEKDREGTLCFSEQKGNRGDLNSCEGTLKRSSTHSVDTMIGFKMHSDKCNSYQGFNFH